MKLVTQVSHPASYHYEINILWFTNSTNITNISKGGLYCKQKMLQLKKTTKTKIIQDEKTVCFRVKPFFGQWHRRFELLFGKFNCICLPVVLSRPVLSFSSFALVNLQLNMINM